MFRSLSRTDLEDALDAVGAITEGVAGGGRFAVHAVQCLRRLVASDLATLSTCNLATGHRCVVSDVPGAISAPEIRAFDRHFHDPPLVRAHGRNPAAVTRRISDLVTAAQFRRSGLFNDYYRRIGIAHAMAVPIHVRRDELVSFVLNRSGSDFGDRDRECVDLIRPHLGNLFRASREIQAARTAWGVPAVGKPAGPELTPREREVLAWLASGKTDRDIGDILAISRRTVHKHLQRVYEKLGVETRTAAVARWMARASHPVGEA